MEKKHVIRYLKERRRGAYTLLVNMYAEEVTSMSVKMVLEFIKEDLEKEPGTSVQLRYFSLARAVARFKKSAAGKPGGLTTRKREFKDAHEIEDRQLRPGEFKVSQDVQSGSNKVT